MITVKNLKKSFGDNEVLKGIDYEIKQGEKIVIIGPSGSGKSTFLRCLNLLETPTEGEIYFDNQLTRDLRVNLLVTSPAISIVRFSGSNTECAYTS